MSLRTRQLAKLGQRIDETLATRLEPGEEIVAWLHAQVRPRLFLGLEFLIGAVTFFFVRQYEIVLTNRRLFALLLSRSGRNLSLAWDEPLPNVRVDKLRHGPLMSRLWLTRKSDGAVLRCLVFRGDRGRTDTIAAALTGS